MKLMIDIDENDYKFSRQCVKSGVGSKADKFIANGTPVSDDRDLISREALKDEMSKVFFNDNDDMKRIEKLIDNAPIVDTDEIYKKGYHNGFFATHGEPERPQGEWINTSPYDDKGECSLCCYLSKKYYKFCPNCGADMRSDKK